MARSILTAEAVAQLLKYDPKTGHLIRTVSRSPNAREGEIAGTPDKHGYIQVQIDGMLYKAHRLAWLLKTGNWPDGILDHADGNPANNSWSNLRLASMSQNMFNAKIRSDNKSGFKGVCFDNRHGRWLAQIQIKGKSHYLGLHDSPEAAHDAYMDAARAAQPKFARAR